MRATLLVTTTPGGGPDVIDATQGDGRFTRRLTSLGRFEACFEVQVDSHDELLDAIALVNDVEAQLASETLLDMEVPGESEADRDHPAEQGLGALVLLDEDKHAGCHYAHTLFQAALEAHDAVVSCYPLLGRFDDAAWLRAEDLTELTEAVRVLQALDGVKATTTLIEAQGS